MNNTFNHIKNRVDVDTPCCFSDYRKAAVEHLTNAPAFKIEQYRKINMPKIFKKAFKKGQLSQNTSFKLNNSSEGVEHMDIESFAEKNPEQFKKYFSTAFEKGAIEQATGTKFKDRTKARSFFVDLNSAFVDCGTVTYISENQSIKEPITIEINHNDIVIGRRDMIVVEKFSKATLIIQNNSTHALLNRVCEIYLEESASLDIIEIDMSNSAKVTVANTIVTLSKGSNFKHYSVIASDNIVRNNIKAMLNGEGADAQLYGAILVYNSGTVSINTVVEHNLSNCTSEEHYKNIATGKGVSDFAGIILVNEDAQKTSAIQRNDNIVLSDNAKVHTKPQLEIYADDVKCTHGATVGQLNDEAIFYMMQRGIARKEAHKLLLTGFLSNVLMKIENDTIREAVIEKMSNTVLSVR